VRTMQLISDLETSPREVYCGAIGIVEPGGNATFSVAIRTAWIDTETTIATYGVGGGITWDSSAGDEYDEALAKAAVLHERWPRFELLETLRLKRGRFALLDAHLDRLAESARYFDIPLDRAKTRSELLRIAKSHAGDRETQFRVRLRVDREGVIAVEAAPYQPVANDPQPVALARTPIDPCDRFLFHKTTHRAVYEHHRQHAPDAFDVLLWNDAGELTEFTIGNLVLRIDGRLWTPPRSSGLLAGVFRDVLVKRGTIAERALRRDDLLRASEMWLINSVRGWVRVTLRDRDLHLLNRS
jgi:para-aminobenzoate synthetase / 4-amino-4-deoxychorismate lyase